VSILRFLPLLTLIAIVLGACTTQPTAHEPVADPATTRSLAGLGTVTGSAGLYGGHAWLGIPFAKPPVGELRWRAPLPPEPFGELAALEHTSVCPQFANAFGGVNNVPSGSLTGSEDCLALDVYAPAFGAGEMPRGAQQLPVMFWIHGGGNSIGTNSFYDGSRLASEQNVIVVAVNYRLGVLGWMRHPKLNDGLGAIEQSGNFGTLDLIRGLEWVRDHIGSFGGDADNVTIFGESAGGHNVFTMLASPLADGLFHRAISQSGGTWEATPANAENFVDDDDPGDVRSSSENLLDYLQQDGRAADRAEAKQLLAGMTADEVASYLRSKPISEVFSVFVDNGSGMVRSPRVFSDGAVLPEVNIAEVLQSEPGRLHRVPLMLGTNRDEDKLFQFFNPNYVTRYLEIIPRVHDAHAYQRDAGLMSRAWKLSGADYPAQLLSETRPGEVFVYRWDWDEQPSVLWADLGWLIGAGHGFEIPFVFGHFDLGPLGNFSWTEENAPGRLQLSAAMRSYWANFARAGDPNDDAHPKWTAWNGSGDRYLVLDTEAGGGIRMSREVETAEQMADEILSDESYADAIERCTNLARLASETYAYFGPDGYAQAGAGRCAAHDMDELLSAHYGE
jgi:para-nitrobenzyl esterase